MITCIGILSECNVTSGKYFRFNLKNQGRTDLRKVTTVIPAKAGIQLENIQARGYIFTAVST